MRATAPAWDAALRGGTESVVCDLKSDPTLARALAARADVLLESFRPGVAARLAIGPDDVPASTVYCSITGFGTEGPHAARAGHDLNYLGWAGVLEDTAPEGLRCKSQTWPPEHSAQSFRSSRGCSSEPEPEKGAHRCVHDARLSRPRRTPPRRGANPADAHRRARLPIT